MKIPKPLLALFHGFRRTRTDDDAAQIARSARRCADEGDPAGLHEIAAAYVSRSKVHIETLVALADVAIDALQHDLALSLAERAIELDPFSAIAHFKRALACQALTRIDEAEAGYRKALALDPSFGKALNNLGCISLYRDDRRAAKEAFEKAIAVDPSLSEPHSNLGQLLLAASDTDRALDGFRRAIALDPGYGEAQLHLSQCLLDMGRVDEAEAVYRQAVAADRRGTLKLRLALMLPEFMHSKEAIQLARNRLSARLAELEAGEWSFSDPIAAVRQCYWFFLAYHGMNDRPLVGRIARLLLRACPFLGFQAAHCAAPAARRKGSRLRLGFASSNLREHTIGKLMMGVIGNLPQDIFDIYVFVPEQQPDRVHRYLQSRVTQVVILPPSLEGARNQIAAFALDILFYPDIGMDAFIYFLAFARLAPMQCVTWGHPMSTGIPAIDYFVTHRECELPGSEQFYSERLLALPAGDALTYYFRPDTAGLDRTRAHYGLSDANTIYLCPQTLFKLHPDQDAAFRKILSADRNGVLVFLEGDKPLLKQLLLERLQRQMPEEISRVRFVPMQPFRDFLNLIKVSDVVLDTFVFGGGNSSMEAFAVGRPVVTLPSDQLRGRLTLACCRRMGIDELVAADAGDFAAKAVRLGTDRSHRAALEAKIAARSGLLFEDKAMVTHLAGLLVDAFEQRATRD